MTKRKRNKEITGTGSTSARPTLTVTNEHKPPTRPPRLGWFGFPLVVWIAAAAIVLIASAVAIAQYYGAVYAWFDLSIFQQVLFNNVEGRWFEYTFSSHSYLVDHRAWLLLPLTLLYAIAPHAETLLVFQSAVFAVGLFPFVLIVRQLLRDRGITDRWLVRGAVAVYLLQPSLWSMTLFEFHMLPLVVPLFFWMWWLMINRRWVATAVCMVLLLLVREDTGLLLVGLSALIVVQPSLIPGVPTTRVRRWAVGVAVVALAWVVLMMKLGVWVSPYEAPKFTIFYDWAGSTPGEAVVYALRHPLETLGVFFGYDHTIVIAMFFLMTGVVSLWRWWIALPAFPFMALLLLSDNFVNWPLVHTHYAAMLLPPFLVAGVYGYDRMLSYIASRPKTHVIHNLDLRSFLVVLPVFLISVHMVTIGPQWEVLHRFELMEGLNTQEYRDAAAVERYGLASTDPILVSERVYTFAANRRYVYPVMHVFTGVQHFTSLPYELPTVEMLTLEHESALRADANMPIELLEGVEDRWSQVIEGNDLVPVRSTQELVVWLDRGRAASQGLEEVVLWESVVDSEVQPEPQAESTVVSDDLLVHSMELNDEDTLVLDVEKIGPTPEPIDSWVANQHIEFTWHDHERTPLSRRLLSIGFGVHPTSTWAVGDRYRLHLPVRVPTEAAGATVRVGRLDQDFGTLLGLWRADPVAAEDAVLLELAVE